MSDQRNHLINPSTRLAWLVSFLVAVALIVPPAQVQAKPDTQVASSFTIYVDSRAPDGGNGTAWGSAYNNLQDALARAQCPTSMQ